MLFHSAQTFRSDLRLRRTAALFRHHERSADVRRVIWATAPHRRCSAHAACEYEDICQCNWPAPSRLHVPSNAQTMAEGLRAGFRYRSSRAYRNQLGKIKRK